ncbi:ImmA/IrrE family metallo-endopeptidase [Corynebacterium sanguinis]|uniref:ImmA/IrrE family metallo-endopeptidase n=1 Tax=Corynebacterium sanguinis TaxID=2594913 RepID=UPI0021A7597E|nr:ImmA/IrrE family metallo-endopeptidase [Corynebacterium sanguinis]MCT1463373.1 ImmA/IrrE family metallo-endopeptidase [Corynebacterium sanguinis]MCT2329981.1 ImmA/IrrE family metallo-endopeptidase [Corynebacterium sanguinis]
MEEELKLLQLAEEMNVTVEDDHLRWLRDGDLGGWFPGAQVILLRPGLGWRNRLHTLAHELGHAHHDHPAGHESRFERQADDFAANLLIDQHAYAEAEKMFGAHLGAIAAELGVTISLLIRWRAQHERKTA